MWADPSRIGDPTSSSSDPLVLPLTAAGRPIGLLVLAAAGQATHDRRSLVLFAHQIALAVERVQLRDQVIQTRLAEQVDRLARMLVTAVSHDLRTPLASIKASSSVLADETLVIREPDARELAGLIDVQADRLTALVGNLLDMSRIQAGVLAPRYATVDLPLLVASVLDELTLLLRDYVVEVDIPGDLPAVIVDRQLIERVLGNLLTNAVRHAPKGTAIGIAARSMGTDLVEVSVSDHGPGVVPEQRTDIFGLTPRRDDEPGAGLGLFISRTFVEAHGQRIWVGDAPSGGARFCFTLAAARVTEGGYQVVQRARH